MKASFDRITFSPGPLLFFVAFFFVAFFFVSSFGLVLICHDSDVHVLLLNTCKGMFGSVVAHPLDVVKVRLQATKSDGRMGT